ncbi:MAG: DUF4935 domain-containing protein [Eubacterium sp.]|nr:DUF4935 domain-containing protein [Eubacterium sp.]
MLQYPINITIDTNVFDECKYDLLENSTLRVLQNYVRDGKVKIYLSDIVLNEAKAHLEEKVSTLVSTIKKNRKELLKVVNEKNVIYMGLGEFTEIPNKSEIYDKMSDLFDEYIESLEPEIFDNSKINIEKILVDYFKYNAPFEKSTEKRNEFPDAFIANQIIENLPAENSFIISKDKGFKKACSLNNKYRYLECLGDLYKMITEQDNNYEKVIVILDELKNKINELIKKEIEKDNCITVDGKSRDRKGVVSGYDYSETSLRDVSNVSHKLFVIDDINVNEALITLKCFADIDVDCYYEDYDNAPWDNEVKEYIFLETKHILEKHKAEYCVRIVLDIIRKRIELDEIAIVLNSDTIKDREEVCDEDITINDGPTYTFCPDCGKEINHQNDGGNGFCTDCAPKH